MPPFPWYFGGQWYNTIFMDSREIFDFAKEMGWGICYDLSHAQLYCNSVKRDLKDFTKNVLPYVDYLHISDAKGVTQEGLQLGLGNLDMDHLFAILQKLDVGFIPEIWSGHLQRGKGMKQALRTIEKLLDNKLAGESHYHVQKH
jgi:N-acetylneuraminate synthase